MLASLPNMQLPTEYNVPTHIVDRLRVPNTTFGGCDRMRPFLPLFASVPDLYSLTRSQANGSLTYEQDTGNETMFRTRNLRSDAEWTAILKKEGSNMDMKLIREIDLMVSVGLWGMRELICQCADISREALPLNGENEVPTNTIRRMFARLPDWYTLYRQYANGQPWLDVMEFEELRLNSMRNGLVTGLPIVQSIPWQRLD